MAGIVLLGYAAAAIMAIMDLGASVRLPLAAFLSLFGSGLSVLALEPRHRSLGWLERLAIAGFLGLAIGGLSGFFLVRTGWGLHFWPLLATSAALNVACLLGAVVQSRRVEAEKSESHVSVRFLTWTVGAWWRQQSLPSRGLTTLLAIATVTGAMQLVRTMAVPPPDVEMTEFYLLDSSGRIDELPREMEYAQPAEVTLVLSNRGPNLRSYEVRSMLDESEIWGPHEVVLSPGASRSLDLTLAPPFGHQKRGPHQVRFTLDENGSTIRSLHIWLDVVGGPAPSWDVPTAIVEFRHE